MSTLVSAIISYVVPSITLALIMWVIKELKRRAKHDNALEEGVKCLLRDRIIQGHRYHIVSGNAVSDEEYSSVQNMIECYKTLKGKNGFIDHIAAEYIKSPIDPGSTH